MVLPSPFLDLVLPRKIIHNLCCPVQQRVLNENIMPRAFYVTDLELHNLKKKAIAVSWNPYSSKLVQSSHPTLRPVIFTLLGTQRDAREWCCSRAYACDSWNGWHSLWGLQQGSVKRQMSHEMILSMTIGQPWQWEIRTVPKAVTIHPDGWKRKGRKLLYLGIYTYIWGRAEWIWIDKVQAQKILWTLTRKYQGTRPC